MAPAARGSASGDQLEYVVTDSLGAWKNGYVLRVSDMDADQTRVVGFTHSVDGTVTAWTVRTAAPTRSHRARGA